MDNSLVVIDEDEIVEAENIERVTPTLVIENMNDLKNLYSDLIKPLKDIEGLLAEKCSSEQKYEDAKTYLKGSFIAPILLALQYTAALAGPFIVIFLIFTFFKKTPDGARWLTVYTDWFADNTHVLDWLLSPLINILPHWLAAILGVIVSVVFVCGIAPVFIFLFPFVLVFAIIASCIKAADCRATTIKAPKAIKGIDDEIEYKMDKIKDGLTFVPPDYRTSDALEYICRAVDNYKADTLKEALLQYDTYVHNRKMEEGQAQMIQYQLQMMGMIEYQNEMLGKLNSDIKSIKHGVWLNTILN